MTDEFAFGMQSQPRPSLRLNVTGLVRRESSLINVVNTGVPASAYTSFTIPDANADLIGPGDDQQLVVYNRRPESFGHDSLPADQSGAGRCDDGCVCDLSHDFKSRDHQIPKSQDRFDCHDFHLEACADGAKDVASKMAKIFPVGEDRIEFPSDMFNMFNNQNLLAGGYINLVGNPRYGQHTGGSSVLPSRQFQFAVTYRF